MAAGLWPKDILSEIGYRRQIFAPRRKWDCLRPLYAGSTMAYSWYPTRIGWNRCSNTISELSCYVNIEGFGNMSWSDIPLYREDKCNRAKRFGSFPERLFLDHKKIWEKIWDNSWTWVWKDVHGWCGGSTPFVIDLMYLHGPWILTSMHFACGMCMWGTDTSLRYQTDANTKSVII